MNDESKAKEDRPVPRLYLIRGLPGSGKSTMGHSLGCCVISPSDFSSHVGGGYYWHRDNYMKHKMAWRSIVRRIMEVQCDICICELMLEKRFIDFWLKEAKDNYYQVRIGTILVDLQTSEQRNVHGVDKTSVKEIHDQMDYGIPDQIIDYSEGEWSKSKVNVEKPYGFIPDESNHYGLIWDDDAGHEIKQLINENQLDRAMELHIKTGKMYENYKPKILE